MGFFRSVDNKRRTVIIDGDILVYKTAEAVSETYEMETDEDDNYIYRTISYANKQKAKDYLKHLILKIKKDTKATNMCICLSSAEGNFRKEINPAYKSNRKNVKPILWSWIRELIEHSNMEIYLKPTLEADDVIGILATSPVIKGEKIVWSLDKDFKTIPCTFYNAKPDGTHKVYKITEAEADWWFMYQTLKGDKVDGYKGCVGVGDSIARKILGAVGEKTLDEMWKDVLNAFKKAGMTEEDALLNARMARILRASDYDFKKKEVKLWNI